MTLGTMNTISGKVAEAERQKPRKISAVLPLRISDHVAEISFSWILTEKGKVILAFCAFAAVSICLSLANTMYLYRRMSDLQSDHDKLVEEYVDALTALQENVALLMELALEDEVDADVRRVRRQAPDVKGKVAKSSGGLVKGVQFRPCLEEIMYSESNAGVVSGWHPEWEAEPFRYQFDALRSQVTILEDGLYYVYVQLYFLHTFEVCGYDLFLRKGNTVTAEDAVEIAKCSISGTNPAANATTGARSEASCFTSVLLPLSKGDMIFARVRELKRYLKLNQGNSFMGFVKLARHPMAAKRNANGRRALRDPICPAN